jgi:hypothetical protein
MTVEESNTTTHEDTPAQAGVALRLFWMLIGNAIVFGSLATIVVNEIAFPAPLDALIWATVALSIAARWLDITRYQGTTASGELATMADWRRHAMTLVLVAALGSVVAHMLGG